MSKKDFSQDSADVFSSMFSKSTIKEVDEKEKEKEKKQTIKESAQLDDSKTEKKEIPVTVVKPEDLKEAIDIISQKKSKRFNFYLEDNLTEYFNNIKWIKRVKNTSDYINNLIREDLIKTLALPEDSSIESILLAWNKYKKKNNI